MKNEMKHFDLQILKKYLGSSFEKEYSSFLSTVRDWFMSGELESELEDASSRVWEEIPLEVEHKELDGERILDKIHHMIKTEESVFMSGVRHKVRIIDYVTRAAAILFIPLLFTCGYLFFKLFPTGKEVPYSEIHAPLGTRTAFYLPDGTTGWINGGSTLRFPPRFTGSTRDVNLSGEAFFNVSPNPRKPFLVTTRYIEAKVYGTAFNIMAYDDEEKTEVTLESGAVQVFKKRVDRKIDLSLLGASQSCIYYHLNDSSRIITVQPSEKTAWKEGRLVFKYEAFSEVVNKLNRWYNVNIVIKDADLEKYVYYGTFEDETLDEVLKLLQFTAPITYRDMGREKRADGTFEKRHIVFYYKR